MNNQSNQPEQYKSNQKLYSTPPQPDKAYTVPPQHQPECSACCQASVTIGGDNREGTHYYMCSKCNNPCDLGVTEPQHQPKVTEKNFGNPGHQLTGSEELEELLCVYQTLRNMHDNSPTAWESLMQDLNSWHTKHLAKARLSEKQVIQALRDASVDSIIKPGQYETILTEKEKTDD